MTLYKGSIPVAGLAKNTIVTGFNIFDCKWSDHIINDIQWLRADTFSWQSGDVYVTAYNTIEEEYSTGVEETEDGITFRRSANGYKIADASQEQAILNKYNTTGIAWYYLRDGENRRFKLPRAKYNQYSNKIPVAGNGMTLGMTNGTTDSAMAFSTYSTDHFYSSANIGNEVGTSAGATVTFGTGTLVGVTTDATKSGVVALPKSDENMHLYFYVGEYAQPAIEQTAGINTELFNGKADVNLNNINDTARITMAHNAMPSNRYINLTLGASGTSYTAPADGYVVAYKVSSAVNQYFNLQTGGATDATVKIQCSQQANTATSLLTCTIPVTKGETFYTVYTAGGTLRFFRFYYAIGSESENL